MEKLDKETLSYDKAQEHWGLVGEQELLEGILVEDWETIYDTYKAGLEYAEEHYLKLIKEKDKEYDALESMWLAEKGINKLIRQQFQQAKELLGELSSALNKTLWQWENPMEQGFKLGNKIEEFLKEKE